VPPAGRRLMATPPPAAEQSPGARLPSPVEWTSNRSATRPDPSHPVHRHDVGRARAPDRKELGHHRYRNEAEGALVRLAGCAVLSRLREAVAGRDVLEAHATIASGLEPGQRQPRERVLALLQVVVVGSICRQIRHSRVLLAPLTVGMIDRVAGAVPATLGGTMRCHNFVADTTCERCVRCYSCAGRARATSRRQPPKLSQSYRGRKEMLGWGRRGPPRRPRRGVV